MWPVLGSLALSLLAAPPDWGARASIEGELSAGALSAGGGDGVEAGAQTEWSPALQVDMALRRLHLVAGYHPRLAWRVPIVERGLPVVLHRLQLRGNARLSRRTSVDASAYLDAGDVYYGRSLWVFDGAAFSSSVPDVDVLSYLSAGADSTLRWRLDRRQDLHASAGVALNRPLGATVGDPAFPEQQRVGVELGHALQATRQHALQLDLQGRWVQFDPGPTYLSASPRLQWRTAWSARWSTTARAGALLAQQQGRVQAGQALRAPLLPVAELGVEGRQRLPWRVPLHLELRGGVDGYYDPVAATLTPQASARTRLEIPLGPRALASAQAYAYIPLGSDEGQTPGVFWREPLLAGGDLRVVPWARREVELEFGLRGFGFWTTRDGLSLERREVVGFVGLRAGLDASG